MKVLLVVSGLPSIKNPARSVFNLAFAKELNSLGMDLRIIYIRAFHPFKKFVVVKEYEGIYVTEIRGIIGNKLSELIPRLSTLVFETILKSQRILGNFKDTQIIHAISGNTVEAAFVLSKLLEKPLLIQFIGSDVNIQLSKSLKRKAFVSCLERSAIITFNSQDLRKVFLNSFPSKKETKVYYRGIKLSEFKYSFLEKGAINILYLGGFPSKGNLKGGHTLLKAIKILDKRDIGNNRVKFTIGGPNSEIFDRLKYEISNNKIDLHFIGSVSRSEVKGQLIQSHIVLIPSLSEGIPNLLFEALASGNMVIASNIGGIPEIIENNLTGILIPPNNPNILADSIIESISKKQDIPKYALKGREKIEGMDYSSFVNNYLMLYQEVIENN